MSEDQELPNENMELLARLDSWKEGTNPGPIIRWAAAHLRGCIALSSPETTPAGVGTLDAERLARAICWSREPQPAYGFVDDECRAEAHRLAAEYDRAALPQPGPDGPDSGVRVAAGLPVWVEPSPETTPAPDAGLREALERIADSALVVAGRCGFCDAPKPVGRYDTPWHREHCVFAIAAAAIAETTPAGVLPVDEVAAWLLRVGYGIDYTFRDDDNKPDLAPLPVLEAMVRLGAQDPSMAGGDGEEGAYYVLSSELGDWRAT